MKSNSLQSVAESYRQMIQPVPAFVRPDWVPSTIAEESAPAFVKAIIEARVNQKDQIEFDGKKYAITEGEIDRHAMTKAANAASTKAEKITDHSKGIDAHTAAYNEHQFAAKLHRSAGDKEAAKAHSAKARYHAGKAKIHAMNEGEEMTDTGSGAALHKKSEDEAANMPPEALPAEVVKSDQPPTEIPAPATDKQPDLAPAPSSMETMSPASPAQSKEEEKPVAESSDSEYVNDKEDDDKEKPAEVKEGVELVGKSLNEEAIHAYIKKAHTRTLRTLWNDYKHHDGHNTIWGKHVGKIKSELGRRGKLSEETKDAHGQIQSIAEAYVQMQHPVNESESDDGYAVVARHAHDLSFKARHSTASRDDHMLAKHIHSAAVNILSMRKGAGSAEQQQHHKAIAYHNSKLGLKEDVAQVNESPEAPQPEGEKKFVDQVAKKEIVDVPSKDSAQTGIDKIVKAPLNTP